MMTMKLLCLLICVYSAVSLKCQVQVIGSNDYVGCFIDTDTRLFPYKYMLNNGSHPPDMENNMCLLHCKELGYMYSGTQNYKECWCGDDPYWYGPENVDDYYKHFNCDRECLADSEQICGGGWRLSAYKTGYLPNKEGRIQYQIVSNNTILTAPANQVLSSRSKIECAQYCKISDNCKVFVISTETRECIPTYFERQNYFMSTCANFKRAILHQYPYPPSLMGAFYIDKYNRII